MRSTGGIAFALAMAAVACGPEARNSLTVAVRGDVTGIFPNPPMQTESHTFDVNSNVFEGLVRFDRNLTPEPALAGRWRRSAPARTRWRRGRRAFELAIDRDELVRRVFDATAVAATQLVTPSVFGYDPGITPPRFDLLNSGQSNFYLVGWACETRDAGDALDALMHSPRGPSLGTSNNQGLADPELDRRIDEANTRSTMTERNQSMGRAIARVSELHAVIPLEIQPEAIALSGKIAWDPPINFGLRLFDR